jgi:hypothetical protein
MTPTRSALSRRDSLWIAALAVGLPLLAMSLLGVDANWDLRNYHLYNVHAWLAGRGHDIAPAMVQSWHNPLLDLPMYLLFTSGLPARATSLWLTLPTIAAIAFLLLLQRALSPAPPSRTSQVVLALLALTGAASYSTLATSFNDSFVAAALLGALWLVLASERVGPARWLLAGLVAGGMAGLKLTAGFYCLALALAAVSGDGLRANLSRLGSLALGGVAGFALTYGWWGLRVARATGNPFFPYFNNVFKSALVPFQSFADARFRPDSLADAVLAPVHLLTKSRSFSEGGLSDPRLLLGLVSLFALVLLYRRSGAHAAIAARLRLLLVFFVASFLLWILQFGFYRYAIVLEMLGSLALVLALANIRRWQAAALVLVLLLVSVDTRRPNWGRVRGMEPGAGIHALPLPRDAMVVSAEDEPLAFMALALPREVPFLGLGTNIVRAGECNGLHRRAEAALRAHAGPVFLVSTRVLTDADEPRRMLQRDYGLYDAGACVPYVNQLGPVQLCPQQRRPVPPRC